MQSPNQLTLPCEVISHGVDWMTATAKAPGSKYAMEELAAGTLARAMDNGEKPIVRSLHGFNGYAVDGFFHGEKEGMGMIQTSGHRANDLWRSVGSVCDNVSRIDLQVTVWTILETPHVARVVHEQIKRGEHGQVPIRNATFIEGHPNGETININKRCSDYSARIYDKASESSLGVPRSVWRYEIECRRRVALAINAALRSADYPGAASLRLVYDWFDRRGIKPLFNPLPDSSTLDLNLVCPKHDAMKWFRDTLSKTIRKQVRLHGLNAVVEALGLYDRI